MSNPFPEPSVCTRCRMRLARFSRPETFTGDDDVLGKLLRQMEVEEMARPFNRGIYVMPSAQEAYERGKELLKKLRMPPPEPPE